VRLEADSIAVTLAGRRVLAGASLSVGAREIVTLEGASGSGKSTLLRVMAMLVDPDAGVVRIDGAPANAMSPRAYRRRVAFVPQQPPMFDGTVEDNVCTGPRLRGAAFGHADAERVLARVGLGGFASRTARDLSGGEKQRVALARALANEPEALLLDEPTSALDPESAKVVIDLVRTLAADGLAIAIVTHVEEHAIALGGTRFRLVGGRVA
jgi:putative ABC transport system ATP-binding protein